MELFGYHVYMNSETNRNPHQEKPMTGYINIHNNGTKTGREYMAGNGHGIWRTYKTEKGARKFLKTMGCTNVVMENVSAHI